MAFPANQNTENNEMGEYLNSLHEAHKARQSRLKEAAFRSVTDEPEPVPIPEPETGTIPEEQIIPLRYRTTFEIVLHEICTYYSVRKMDIISPRRLNNICYPRHMLIYMLYKMTTFTNGQIAQNMHRDMSSITYAINKIINNIKSHQSDIDELEKRIVEILEQRKAFALAERK